MSYTAHRYGRTGLLAIDPSALFEVFISSGGVVANEERPEATIVTVRGPLDQHASRWCDSYESICARVADACDKPAPAILMRFDSPGGEAAGCLEGARDVRKMCDAAGKRLIAFVENKAASAAYAFASCAHEIVLSDTAIVGSIGILSVRPDVSAMNAAQGIRVEFIASGSRKAYGNAEVPITDAELKDQQALVNSMAAVFFELVAEMRARTVEEISALEAGSFHGAQALAAGLADGVQPFKTTLASLASSQGQKAMADDKKKEDEGGDFETVRQALTKLAKGDDANAKRAKIALAALEGEDDEKKDDDEAPDAEADTDEEKKAEADPDDDKKAEVPEKGESAAMRIALRAEARSAKLEAELKRRDDAEERARLIAAHPKLSASMVALLNKSPLKLVRETLKELGPGEEEEEDDDDAAQLKNAGARASLAALQPGVKPSPGVDRASKQRGDIPDADRKLLDRAFNLTAQAPGIVESEFRLTLGELVPAPVKPKEPEKKETAARS